jgi:hypothetical protein
MALLPYASRCCCWGSAAKAGLIGAGDAMLGVGDATRKGVGLRVVVGVREGGDGGGSDMADMLLAGDAGLDMDPGSSSNYTT